MRLENTSAPVDGRCFASWELPSLPKVDLSAIEFPLEALVRVWRRLSHHSVSHSITGYQGRFSATRLFPLHIHHFPRLNSPLYRLSPQVWCALLLAVLIGDYGIASITFLHDIFLLIEPSRFWQVVATKVHPQRYDEGADKGTFRPGSGGLG